MTMTMTSSPPRTTTAADDASTVQLTAATSLLGTHLLESDWNEALQHLATPEGIRDVRIADDPLGLFLDRSRNSESRPNVPPSKTSALFASLFVRAPFAVVSEIYRIDPSLYEPDDLSYALSVIPSEEAERSSTSTRSVPYRSRTWSKKEYEEILRLLLRHSMNRPSYSSSSPFLVRCPNWILPFSLTPLAIAAYNPDVPHEILRRICALEPGAIDVECTLFGVATTPLFIAAASPLPPRPSALSAAAPTLMRYEEIKENRWSKVQSLVLGPEWYNLQSQNIINDPAEPVTREPTIQEIHDACRNAIQRNEWELVREFLKRQHEEAPPVVQAQFEHADFREHGTDVDIQVSPLAIAEPVTGHGAIAEPFSSSSLLDPIRDALTEHDRKAGTKAQKRQDAEEKARARDEWARKNMGLVMYPIDAAVDLAMAMIPSSWRKKARGGEENEIRGIVSRMS